MQNKAIAHPSWVAAGSWGLAELGKIKKQTDNPKNKEDQNQAKPSKQGGVWLFCRL